jgi:hypothetical protein
MLINCAHPATRKLTPEVRISSVKQTLLMILIVMMMVVGCIGVAGLFTSRNIDCCVCERVGDVVDEIVRL